MASAKYNDMYIKLFMQFGFTDTWLLKTLHERSVIFSEKDNDCCGGLVTWFNTSSQVPIFSSSEVPIAMVADHSYSSCRYNYS